MKLADWKNAGFFVDEEWSIKSIEVDGFKDDFAIKNEMSAADFEFVYGVGSTKETVDLNDECYTARRVHRFARADGGKEPISYAEAVKIGCALSHKITDAINEVHDETEAKKKNSRKKKSSGTS